MTVSEDLQFSILSAPVASFDRRALSQAWYSALYGSAASSAESGSMQRNGCAPKTAMKQRATSRSAVQRTTMAQSSAAVGHPQTARFGDIERRASRSPLARKIERAFLHPRAAVRKAAFTIEGAQGRVQVLLQSRGARIKLIAICPAKARNEVAIALAQARYALAQRGIDLETQTRSDGAW
jgi:hypothetical protein